MGVVLLGFFMRSFGTSLTRLSNELHEGVFVDEPYRAYLDTLDALLS